MKTLIKTLFVVVVFGTLLFLGQVARWYHLGTPIIKDDTIRTEPVALTDSLQKYHPLNHFYYYRIDVNYVYSRGTFPFRNLQTDTTKKEMLFI